MERGRLISAVEVLADNPSLDEADLAALLVSRGFTIGEAYRLIAFVPIAFSRPVMEELGVSNFSDTVSVPTEDGGFIEPLLSDQPEYVAALALARDHRRSGVMPHQWYTGITGASSEIEAASNALNEGADLTGSAISTALVNADHAKYVVMRAAH
jgi:hypothetical protein